MKRDMELVRKLLAAIEQLDGSETASAIAVEGYSKEQIVYHAKILLDEGLILASDSSGMAVSRDVLISRLTWSGHEFIDAARDETRWTKVKQMVANAGGATLPVWLSLLERYLRQQLGLED